MKSVILPPRARLWFLLAILGSTCGLARHSVAADAFPKVGDVAENFELTSVTEDKVTLKDRLANGPVVLVVLRGYPGYQCPACHQQVAELIRSAEALRKSGAQVLLVYPGASEGLSVRAREFLGKGEIPKEFTLLPDPDYKFTNAYGLRWNAPQETAYPATFVLEKETGKIAFAQVSKQHGGRAKTADVLKALGKLKSRP
jgi:peroxiredoxin Q/BCP